MLSVSGQGQLWLEKPQNVRRPFGLVNVLEQLFLILILDFQRDVDFNKSVHILFPFSGGPVIAAGVLGKHRRTPEVTPEKINFSALCG